MYKFTYINICIVFACRIHVRVLFVFRCKPGLRPKGRWTSLPNFVHSLRRCPLKYTNFGTGGIDHTHRVPWPNHCYWNTQFLAKLCINMSNFFEFFQKPVYCSHFLKYLFSILEVVSEFPVLEFEVFAGQRPRPL